MARVQNKAVADLQTSETSIKDRIKQEQDAAVRAEMVYNGHINTAEVLKEQLKEVQDALVLITNTPKKKAKKDAPASE